MVEDKRTRNTELRLRQAMINCLNSTSLDKISIMQICETAQINRSTFYAHYQNPLALYKILEQSMIDDMEQYFKSFKENNSSYVEFLTQALKYNYDNSDLFLALFRSDSTSLKNRYMDLIRRYDFIDVAVPEDEQTYILDYYISGFFSVTARWLREDRTKSIDAMVKLTSGLLNKS
ncbi:MAG: TetR/AcrR family transcriptional regulator [Eubacterium sp.]|nr:TetR/AcrR family transcriptional regulator [Eubacterium sp.]